MKTLPNTPGSRNWKPTAVLLVTLLISLPWMASRAQAELTIDSISPTAYGVRIGWTTPATNQAFTVQIRDSLTSGNWRNATTRYRWPWPHTHWADAPVGLPRARYYRVVSETVTPPDRGKLLTRSLREQYTPAQLNGLFAEWGIDGFARPKFGTTARPFTYETIDPYGLPITASALLVVPRDTNGPLPLVSMQHGSIPYKVGAPSQPVEGISGDLLFSFWAYALASQGYAVVVPDYLGLGNSPGYQAYLHARSEATCVVDALRAGRSLCASNAVSLNGRLFLTGYSQGGHVTMAAHRELEAFHADEFPVTASAPCAGPYDLGGVTIESILANRGYESPPYFALMLASYLPIYQLGDTLEEVLAEPYRRTLPPLLDGTRGFGAISAAMPSDVVAILRPDFQADFRGNVLNPLRQALLENNTLAWTPKAPVRMVHCRGDTVVPFANAEVASGSFTSRGACCVSVVDPGAPASLDHDACYVPSLGEVMAWFGTFPP